jgi:hypothetical protein
MRPVLALASVLLICLIAPAAAPAKVLFGVGDQQAKSYEDSKLRALKLQTARYVIAWDWYKEPWMIHEADVWMASVRAAGLRPMIVFNRNWRRSGKYKVPSLASYVKSFKLLRARYPDVRDFSPWNEPNVPAQPFARKPALAAKYHNALRRACPSCTIVAGDINDNPNMASWLSVYKRHVRRPKVWGLHNYRDAHRLIGSTRLFLRMVRGPLWLTETGGIRLRGGEAAQAQATRNLFSIVRANKRIRRLYFYQWRHHTKNRWDSAFFSASGKPRASYHTLRAELRRR